MPVQSIDSFDVHSCTNLSQVGSLGVHSKSKKRKPLHCTSKVGFRTLVRPGKASSMLLCRDVMHPCVFWTSSAQVVPSVKDDFYIYISIVFFLLECLFFFIEEVKLFLGVSEADHPDPTCTAAWCTWTQGGVRRSDARARTDKGCVGKLSYAAQHNRIISYQLTFESKRHPASCSYRI